MGKDIGPILEGWEHDPEEMQVRIIPGIDGREKLQMRIDLGILQMELTGRPDGERPDGADSLLDLMESQARRLAADGEDFSLEPEMCLALMREGVQYYHRYIALFHLERYDLVARDTARNLRLFAFAVKHATVPRDRIKFDQYRPYVTMMHGRALGLAAVEKGDYKDALVRIDESISGIRSFLRDYEQDENEGECQELQFLINWRKQVERDRPVGPIERLEQQLDLAVSTEDFEEAAQIRDQIRRLREGLDLAKGETSSRQHGGLT